MEDFISITTYIAVFIFPILAFLFLFFKRKHTSRLSADALYFYPKIFLDTTLLTFLYLTLDAVLVLSGLYRQETWLIENFLVAIFSGVVMLISLTLLAIHHAKQAKNTGPLSHQQKQGLQIQTTDSLGITHSNVGVRKPAILSLVVLVITFQLLLLFVEYIRSGGGDWFEFLVLDILWINGANILLLYLIYIYSHTGQFYKPLGAFATLLTLILSVDDAGFFSNIYWHLWGWSTMQELAWGITFIFLLIIKLKALYFMYKNSN